MRIVGVLLAAVVALVATIAPVRAHAVLVEARPADGTTLWVAPREVVLRFSETVVPVAVRVLSAEGRSIAGQAQLRAEGETLRLMLPAGLTDGVYVTSYRVISADSHPVSGSVTFVVGSAVAPERDVAGEISVWRAPAAASRAVFLAALLMLAGGVLALGRLHGFAADAVARERRVLTVAGLVLLAAAFASFVFTGALLTALSPFDADALRVALRSSLAGSLALTAVGAGLILAALWAQGQGTAAVAVIGALVAIGATGLTGHAATTAPWPLLACAVVLHVACAAFWAGSLRPLLSALRHDPESKAVAARFSSDAVIVVVLLLAAGIGIAVVQVRHVAMLWQSPYGLILCAKLALVAVLLGVALFNKLQLLPRLARPEIARYFRLAVAIEYVLFAAIVGATAALSQVEPPRTQVTRDLADVAAGRAFTETAEQGGRRVTLSLAPARAGHNVIGVVIIGANGAPAEVKDVTLEMSLPSAGIEPLRRDAEREATGRYTYHSNDLATPGQWRIDVQVLIDDFTRQPFRFEVPVR